MDEKNSNKKNAIIASIAALAVISILIALFVISAERSRHDVIVLPDPPAADTPQTPPAQEDPEDIFAQITTDNVQSILAGLNRPEYYHQTLTLTTYADDAVREQHADLWCAGTLMLVRLTDSLEPVNYLTDGHKLYIWYADAEDVVSLTLNGETHRDELTGVPTYESLLNAQKSELDDVEFLSLDADDGGLQCVFVQCTQGGVQRCYWVSLDSGLLYRYTALSGGEPFYTVQQTQLEQLMEGDEALHGVFRLPDGTDPFAEKTEEAASEDAATSG